MAVVDISRSAAQLDETERRRADLDARDREHGGMLSLDVEVAEQDKRDSMRGWTSPYRADAGRAEVAALRRAHESGAAVIDSRPIDAERLLSDCRAAVRRFTRLHRFGGATRPETVADILATDTAMLVIQWDSYGGGIDPKTGKRSAVIPLGPSGELPSRYVWLERVENPAARDRRWKLTAGAWAVLLAAVKQAARSGDVAAQAETDAHETLSEPTMPETETSGRKRSGSGMIDLTADIEQSGRETDAATRLPDNAAPEIIARYLGVSLDAARSIVEKAYPHATRRDLAESWGVSESSLKVSLARGAKRVRETYPDPRDLLDALDSIGPRWRADLSADLALAALSARAVRGARYLAEDSAMREPTRARRVLAWIDAAEPVAPRWTAAQDIARDWRHAYGELSAERRALELAARHAARRCAGIARRLRLDWRGLDPERVSASVSRIMRAEHARGRAVAQTAARGGAALRTPMVSPAHWNYNARSVSIAPVERIPSAYRMLDYARCAEQDRAMRRTSPETR